MRYPNFEQKVREQIVAPHSEQQNTPGYGIIINFNSYANMADVILTQPGSDEPGEVYYDVPYPTSNGVQGVAPEVGRPCWVVFKDGTQSFPVITHVFNPRAHAALDYDRQYRATTNLPKYLTSL